VGISSRLFLLTDDDKNIRYFTVFVLMVFLWTGYICPSLVVNGLCRY